MLSNLQNFLLGGRWVEVRCLPGSEFPGHGSLGVHGTRREARGVNGTFHQWSHGSTLKHTHHKVPQW